MADKATNETRKQKTPMHLAETEADERRESKASEKKHAADAKDMDVRDTEGIDKANS
jgi:hypothetical protein